MTISVILVPNNGCNFCVWGVDNGKLVDNGRDDSRVYVPGDEEGLILVERDLSVNTIQFLILSDTTR